MPIKVRSTFKKQEFEYESPDGDIWLINYVESEGRKYVQIGREGAEEKDFATWDVPMLLDIADQIRGMASVLKSKPPGVRQALGLKVPNISDHRSSIPQVNEIEDSVANTMSNYDSKAQPIESFSPPKVQGREPNSWDNFRTGGKGCTRSLSGREPPPGRWRRWTCR